MPSVNYLILDFRAILLGSKCIMYSLDHVNLITAKRQKSSIVKNTGCGIRLPERLSQMEQFSVSSWASCLSLIQFPDL